jgi:hypothetical protein
MPEVPDCELTRHLQDALGEIEGTWKAKWYPPTPESVERCEKALDAALGLLAHAWIARNTTGKGMLVVPLAEEPPNAGNVGETPRWQRDGFAGKRHVDPRGQYGNTT